MWTIPSIVWFVIYHRDKSGNHWLESEVGYNMIVTQILKKGTNILNKLNKLNEDEISDMDRLFPYMF